MTSGYDFLDQLRSDLVHLPAQADTRGTRRRWLVGTPIGLAVACAAAVLVLARGNSGTVPAASAETFLKTAADRALAAPAARLGPGRELYDGHPLYRFLGSATHPGATALGNRSLTYAQLRALPTDPERLAGVVRRASTPSGQVGLSSSEYRTIGQLLGGSPWPIRPALRSALLRVAATIPGLEVESGARDCAGRAATAIVEHERGYDDDKPVRMRFELFFNPKSYLFIGERAAVVGQKKPFRCIALLAAGVVDSMTARP